MDQAEEDTYKRLNFFCQEQMNHSLKTAKLNGGPTRGQRPLIASEQHYLLKSIDRSHENYILNKGHGKSNHQNPKSWPRPD